MITYFNNGLLSPETHETDDGILTKKALILAEGDWVDSKKRPHTFSADRLETIAFNTNRDFNSGLFIPILKDHNKDVNGYCGQLDSEIEVKKIEPQDLPAESRHRLSHLIGRVGLFANRVLIKAKDVANQVRQGLNTISPGIDITSDKIREISITPIPAIPGMSLFMKNTTPTAITWEDLDKHNTDLDELKEALEELNEKFYTLVSNIYMSNEEDLQGQDQMSLLSNALQSYFEKVSETVGLTEETDMGEEGYMPSNAADAISQQQYMAMQNPQMIGYSMGETAKYLANFATDEELAEFSILDWGKSIRQSLGDAYQRGRNVSMSKAKVGRDFDLQYEEYIKNNLNADEAARRSLSTAEEKLNTINSNKDRVTRGVQRQLANPEKRKLITMGNRLAGVGAMVKQTGKGIKRFYTKDGKPRWGRIAATGAGTAGVVGTGMYFNRKKEENNPINNTFINKFFK